MQTLFNSFIVQIILSGILFVMIAFFIIKNSRLKKEIESAISSADKKE